MSSAYFAPLVTLPIVIDRPGLYRTRGGGRAQVTAASQRNDFGCVGRYVGGPNERWHRSGRIFAGIETENDIIEFIE